MAEKNPKVAVLMATYNGKQWLSEQIGSILNQANVDLKVFVSDDLSSDSTLLILNEFSLSDPRVIVLPTDNKFGSAGKNFYRLIADVDFAGYDYIAFADQDDVWFKDKITTGIQQLIQQGAEGYSSDVIAFWEDGSEFYVKKSYKQKAFDYLFESAGPGCTFILTNKLASLVQRQLSENLQQEKSFFHHDWLIYALARSKGMKWVINNTPGMMYRQHAGNETGVNAGFYAFVARLKKLRSGWYLDHVYHIAKIVQKSDILIRIIGRNRDKPINFPLHFISSRRRFRDCICLLIFIVLRIAK